MPYKDVEVQKVAQRRLKKSKRLERRTYLLKGKICTRCGFSDVRALEFHHRDPMEKDVPITQMLTYRMEKVVSRGGEMRYIVC